jgi:anti-sigma regulatory factor (Ser/Thr protein kinase)
VTLDQQFDRSTLHSVREAAHACAVAAGMTGERAADVMIAVHELAANAVVHGGGSGRIQASDGNGELVIVVSDSGPASLANHAAGAPGRQRPAGTADPTWPYQPGHGLWLARRVASRISVDSSPAGSRVTVAFDLALTGIPSNAASPGTTR